MFFNTQRKAPTKTTNLAGGEAFTETPKLELVSVLLTSTLKDEFYRKADATVKRVKQLVAEIPDKSFSAKAAVYARNEAGMRSVTHLVAGEIAKAVKGQAWTAPFYRKLCRRPDDALEILACYTAQYGRPIPNALKKGLGQALAEFDGYQLAKYRRQGAELSLVDLVNLVHPPHSEPLAQLMKGSLAPAETWETKLTQAGQKAESEDEAEANKAEAWEQLITSRKLGYFALLRNLRNILTAVPHLIDDVIALLTDERLIKRSLVLPFRYTTAFEALEKDHPNGVLRVIAALSEAVDFSLQNVPKFPGKTLVALDGSGSMMGRPIKIGSLFAAVLAKANDADVMLFSDDAKYVALNKRDSTLTLARWLESQCASAGTNFHAIFQRANRAYDRVLILSDMQGWIGGHAPTATFAQWKAKHSANPKVFSFDLNGYGTLQFPEREVYALAGWSDKSLEMLQFLDADKRALINEIEKIQLV
ncbi:MAG: TROVE domain-containing protein [Verrucomicrobiaceae bacterium]|nr:TROVE domain-containing protein [Verrucomicrobiaceae bacterium]